MKKLLEKLGLEKLFEKEETLREQIERIERQQVQERERNREEWVDGKVIEIIIASDNHGETENLKKVLAQHPNADYYLHCGDSNLEPIHEVMKPFTSVIGNTDYGLKYANNKTIYLPTGEVIWMVHGHQHGVYGGTDNLLNSAKSWLSTPANIILYGHTHKADIKMQADTLIINPGSLERPRDGNIPKYVKLLITQKLYSVYLLDANNHSAIKEFQFPR